MTGPVPAGTVRTVTTSTDPEAAERDRLFARSWVFLAHESEIPDPGDYVVRRVLADSFIVARDEAGAVRADSRRLRGETSRGRAARARTRREGPVPASACCISEQLAGLADGVQRT